MSTIDQAVEILRAGGLVAFPTETVYGLGADALNEAAIHKVFAAKQRPLTHPLIVHLAKNADLTPWVTEIPASAERLMAAFWPGPMTLILKKQPAVSKLVTGGQDTVAIRVPQHPVAQALLQAFGGGVVAPSANLFTHISPTTAQAVREELGRVVDLILDGGNCEVGLESTIIDVSQNEPAILRPGMLTAQQIEAVLGFPLHIATKNAPRVPGRHILHYAPHTPTHLIQAAEINPLAHALTSTELPVSFLLHSPISPPSLPGIHWHQLPNEATAYAHDLYHVLRELDKQQFKSIYIEEVSASSEWEAIRDRLQKASR